MAYGKKYKFGFESTNGSQLEIYVSEKNYLGNVQTRSLGRAPVLKRESNGSIYGTSLEIYAECKVDGEFSALYTSAADQYMVTVYKNGINIWVGFITPELYSEPSVAPPYDVQIIATDGLGELKNEEYNSHGAISLRQHIINLLSRTNLTLPVEVLTTLKASETDALSTIIDLDFMSSMTCYEVMQRILSSIHATITQNGASWLLMRETDVFNKISDNGLLVQVDNNNKYLPIEEIGSAMSSSWWPVGRLTSTISPAKNTLSLLSENSYKPNVFSWESWDVNTSAIYDSVNGIYKLPNANSKISQKIYFNQEVGFRLLLTLKVRNVGSATEEIQNLGVSVKISGRSYSGKKTYWLVKPNFEENRTQAQYVFRGEEGSFEVEIAQPNVADTDSDVNNIQIIIPLYYYNMRSYMYATDIEVSLFNPSGIHDIYIYDISLSKYEQIKGYETTINFNNGAREKGENITVAISSKTAHQFSDSYQFMYGVPLINNIVVNEWATAIYGNQDLSSLLALDYATSYARPRYAVTGVINVPLNQDIPMVFVFDNKYYLLQRYSYNLLNDELEISLLSIPNVIVEAQNIVEAQISASGGSATSSSGGGAGGGSGSGTIILDSEMSDTSTNAVENKTIKAYVDSENAIQDESITNIIQYVLEQGAHLAAMWKLSDDGSSVKTEKGVLIKGYTAIHSGNIGSQSVAKANTATSATKLANKRKLWGQEFDGSADIVGSLTLNAIAGAAWYRGIKFMDSSGTTQLSFIGAYGTADGFQYAYIGGTHTSPHFSIDANGKAIFFGVLEPKMNVYCANSVYVRGAHLMLGNKEEGIYLTKTGIWWHDANDSWAANLLGFSKTEIKAYQTLRPNSNQLCALGTSSYRWSGIYAATGDFSGNISVKGNLIIMGDVASA